MKGCAKQTAGNWQVERFRSLRAEFSKLLRRFRETEDQGERLRLMESAHSIIDEARYVMEQHRQRLRAKSAQPVIEIQNRTMNQRQTQRPKRKNGPVDIVAFRHIQRSRPKQSHRRTFNIKAHDSSTSWGRNFVTSFSGHKTPGHSKAGILLHGKRDCESRLRRNP